MKKVEAIIFSDLHINDYPKFNSNYKRTQNHLRVLFLIRGLCKEYKCPAIFCGDLFHKPELIENHMLEMVMSTFIELDKSDWKIYAISGNHDMSETNSIDKHSPSWIRSFSKGYKFLECIDWQDVLIGDNIIIHGVPYIDHNIGLNQYVKNIPLMSDAKHILLLHTDYPGAKDTDGVEVGSVENLNINSLSRFDLILCGHIHKPQRLSKKVYMVGAPLQQRRTDKDCKLGYWKLYSDLSIEFVAFEEFPRFIDVTSEEEVKDDGNYYTVISVEKEESKSETNRINKKLSQVGIVRKYLRTKGIKDPEKKDILVKLIKAAEND